VGKGTGLSGHKDKYCSLNCPLLSLFLLDSKIPRDGKSSDWFYADSFWIVIYFLRYCLIDWMWWEFAIGSGILHLSCWTFLKNLFIHHKGEKKKKTTSRNCEKNLAWSDPSLWIRFIFHATFVHNWFVFEKGVLVQSPQHVGRMTFFHQKAI
jgi:hypothetical protein